MPVTINASANGPFIISPPESQQVTVVGTGGEQLAPAAHDASIALCRCGHSANKPFCDGSHASVGFKDPA